MLAFLLIFAYMLIGTFVSVATNAAFDDPCDFPFGLVLGFWPVVIVLLILYGIIYLFATSGQKLGEWILKKGKY